MIISDSEPLHYVESENKGCGINEIVQQMQIIKFLDSESQVAWRSVSTLLRCCGPDRADR